MTARGASDQVSPDQVADVLGTVASAGVLTLLSIAVLRGVAPARFEHVRHATAGSGNALAGAVALGASIASLWFSKGAHFPPCELCWYQRIALYPLAAILPLAAIRSDSAARRYGLVLGSVGLVVSAWHNLIETFPSLDSGACDPANPCTLRWVEGLGFWTIPRMAFVTFCLVLGALLLDQPSRRTDDRLAP